MASHESEWLTLGQACDLLGIHPTTLRTWVRAGQLNAFRTPGGHRRFRVADLRDFISKRGSTLPPGEPDATPDRTLLLVRERLSPALMQGQTWYRELPDRDRIYHRDTGRRLLGLLLHFVDRGTSADLLAKVRELGQAYGIGFRESKLPVSEVARAFVLFRRMIADSTLGALEPSRMSDIAKTNLEARINEFMDELLIAILAGYETSLLKERSATSRGHHTKMAPHRGKSKHLARV